MELAGVVPVDLLKNMLSAFIIQLSPSIFGYMCIGLGMVLNAT